jgi:hypothetical protein
VTKLQRKRLDVSEVEELVLKKIRRFELENSGRGVRLDDLALSPTHILRSADLLARLSWRGLIELRRDGLIYTAGVARQMNMSWWKNGHGQNG